MRRILAYWLPVFLWAGVIFLFSSQSSLPHSQDNLLDVIMGKTAHFLEFGILAGLILRAFRSAGSLTPKLLLYSWTLAVLYAVSDEVHQSMVPQRTPSPVDVGIDSIGVVFGLAATWVAGRRSWAFVARLRVRG
ncbi:MAG: VanZ family protein [Dehalococcoidia bacterium]|nr:VanZ family protein [Dehalococcoidia bacterium]